MRQEDCKFEFSLGSLERPCLKIKNLKRARDVAQNKGPGFNPQYWKKQTTITITIITVLVLRQIFKSHISALVYIWGDSGSGAKLLEVPEFLRHGLCGHLGKWQPTQCAKQIEWKDWAEKEDWRAL